MRIRVQFTRSHHLHPVGNAHRANVYGLLTSDLPGYLAADFPRYCDSHTLSRYITPV